MLHTLLTQNRQSVTYVQDAVTMAQVSTHDQPSQASVSITQQTPERPRLVEGGGFVRPTEPTPRQRHEDTRSRPAARQAEMPPYDYRPGSLDRALSDGAFRPWGNFENIAQLTDDEELQRRVSLLLATNMDPSKADRTGRRFHAHFHVTRGKKKVKATLGDLSLAEYNYGLIQMIKLHEGIIKKAMQTHLEEINEDAMYYNWDDIRSWSEEVCSRISEGRLGRMTLKFRICVSVSHRSIDH